MLYPHISSRGFLSHNVSAVYDVFLRPIRKNAKHFYGRKKMWRNKNTQRAQARLCFCVARAAEGGEAFTGLLRLQKKYFFCYSFIFENNFYFCFTFLFHLSSFSFFFLSYISSFSSSYAAFFFFFTIFSFTLHFPMLCTTQYNNHWIFTFSCVLNVNLVIPLQYVISANTGSTICMRLEYIFLYLGLSIFSLIFWHKFSLYLNTGINNVRNFFLLFFECIHLSAC